MRLCQLHEHHERCTDSLCDSLVPSLITDVCTCDTQIKAIEGIKQHPDYQNLKISYGKDRCGGAPRAFRGFDLRNQRQNQQQQQQNGSDLNAGVVPANGFPRSPFTADNMSFPASPMQNDQLQVAEGGAVASSTPLPEIGALVLDEDAAAAATGANGNKA